MANFLLNFQSTDNSVNYSKNVLNALNLVTCRRSWLEICLEYVSRVVNCETRAFLCIFSKNLFLLPVLPKTPSLRMKKRHEIANLFCFNDHLQVLFDSWPFPSINEFKQFVSGFSFQFQTSKAAKLIRNIRTIWNKKTIISS